MKTKKISPYRALTIRFNEQRLAHQKMYLEFSETRGRLRDAEDSILRLTDIANEWETTARNLVSIISNPNK